MSWMECVVCGNGFTDESGGGAGGYYCSRLAVWLPLVMPTLPVESPVGWMKRTSGSTTPSTTIHPTMRNRNRTPGRRQLDLPIVVCGYSLGDTVVSPPSTLSRAHFRPSQM